MLYERLREMIYNLQKQSKPLGQADPSHVNQLQSK